MSPWLFPMWVWLIATLLAQGAEVGTGFTTSQLAWALLEGETQAAVVSGDWKPAGGQVYIGNEVIGYESVAETCVGLPVQTPCLTGLQRGAQGTDQGSYAAGSSVRGSESQVLSTLTDLRLVKTDTGWGVVTWPVQSFRSLANIIIEIGQWDYSYLDGHGQWLAIFMQLLNLGLLVSMVKLFAGPLSSLASGLARGLTGGRLG